MKRIYTDVDEVLLRWLDSFRDYVLDRGLAVNGDYPIQWDLSHWIKGPWKPMIEEFNQSPMFGQLLPFTDAAEVIPLLHERGYEIVAISSCSDKKQAYRDRKRNLHKYFDDCIAHLVTLDLGQSKHDTLGNLPPGLWVEDRMEGALDGMVHGHRSLLIDRPHNKYQRHPKVKRVKCWYGVMAEAENFYADKPQVMRSEQLSFPLEK